MKQGVKSFIISLVVIMALGGATGFLMSATGMFDKVTNKSTSKGSSELPKVSDATNDDDNSNTNISDDSTTSDIDSSTKDDDTINDNSTIDLSKIDHCTYRIENIKSSYLEQTKFNLYDLKVYETQYNVTNGIINEEFENKMWECNNFYYRVVSSSDFKPCDSYMISLNTIDNYEIYFKTEYGKSDVYNFSVSEDLTLEDKDHIELLATLKRSNLYENDKLYASDFEVVKKTFNKKGDILFTSSNLVIDNLVTLNLLNSDNSLTAISNSIDITSTNSFNVCFTLNEKENVKSNVITINPKQDKSSSELTILGLKTVYNWNDSISLNGLTINKIDKDRDGVQYAVNKITNFSTFLKKDNESYKEIITNTIQLDNAGSYSIYFKVGNICSQVFSFTVNEMDSTKTQAHIRIKKQPTKTEYCEYDNRAGVKLDLSGLEVEEYYINNGKEVNTPKLIEDYQVSDLVGKSITKDCNLSELTNFTPNMNYKLHISKANTITDETSKDINISIVTAKSYSSKIDVDGLDQLHFVEGDKFKDDGLTVYLNSTFTRQDGTSETISERITNYRVQIDDYPIGIDFAFPYYGDYDLVFLANDWKGEEQIFGTIIKVSEQHNYVNSELIVEDNQTYLYSIDDTISKSNFTVTKRDNYTTLQGDKRPEDKKITDFSVYVNNQELGKELKTTSSNTLLISQPKVKKLIKKDTIADFGTIGKFTSMINHSDLDGAVKIIDPSITDGKIIYPGSIINLPDLDQTKYSYSRWLHTSLRHWRYRIKIQDSEGNSITPLPQNREICDEAVHTFPSGSDICEVCGYKQIHYWNGLLSELPTPTDGKYILKIVDNTSKLTFTKELTIEQYSVNKLSDVSLGKYYSLSDMDSYLYFKLGSYINVKKGSLATNYKYEMLTTEDLYNVKVGKTDLANTVIMQNIDSNDEISEWNFKSWYNTDKQELQTDIKINIYSISNFLLKSINARLHWTFDITGRATYSGGGYKYSGTKSFIMQFEGI